MGLHGFVHVLANAGGSGGGQNSDRAMALGLRLHLLPGQRLKSPGLMLRPLHGQERRWNLRVNGQIHRLKQSSGGALRWDHAG